MYGEQNVDINSNATTTHRNTFHLQIKASSSVYLQSKSLNQYQKTSHYNYAMIFVSPVFDI